MQLSLVTVILGHVLICTPFAVAILTSAFQSLDKSLEEAAYDLGEGPISTFCLVILPLVMPGIISSLLISFTISLDEFVVSNFLGSNGQIAVGLHFRPVPLPAKACRRSWRLGRCWWRCRSCCCRSLNISAAVALPGLVPKIPEASCDV